MLSILSWLLNLLWEVISLFNYPFPLVNVISFSKWWITYKFTVQWYHLNWNKSSTIIQSIERNYVSKYVFHFISAPLLTEYNHVNEIQIMNIGYKWKQLKNKWIIHKAEELDIRGGTITYVLDSRHEKRMFLWFVHNLVTL